MSEKLKQLPGAQKKAVVGLACMIVAQGNDGHFRTDAPEVQHIVDECFGEDWVGTWDDDYRHLYFARAVSQDWEESIRTVSSLDMETKYAFKNMMIDLIGENVMGIMAAAYVYKEIGLPAATQPPRREIPRSARNTQEDDGTYVVKDAFFARLTDVGAVRGDRNKVFTLMEHADDPGVTVGTNYEAWEKKGVCPVKGIIGYVRGDKKESTPEGTLFYLICEDYLIVPVLEWGLERIDEWTYREKRQYNAILSCDRNGKLLAALRTQKITPAPYAVSDDTSLNQDRKVVHFMANVQERFEPGKCFPSSYVQRQIHLTYTKRGSHLQLEVLGVMKPRYARFENDDGRIITYRDTTNPTAYYEVETEPDHNSIVRVSIFQLNESLDYVEYRYRIE